jgi:hypothetical protein
MRDAISFGALSKLSDAVGLAGLTDVRVLMLWQRGGCKRVQCLAALLFVCLQCLAASVAVA